MLFKREYGVEEEQKLQMIKLNQKEYQEKVKIEKKREKGNCYVKKHRAKKKYQKIIKK